MGEFPDDGKDAKYILVGAQKSFGAVGMRADAVVPGKFITKKEAMEIIVKKNMCAEHVNAEWGDKGVACIWLETEGSESDPSNECAKKMLYSKRDVYGDAIIFARA